MEIPSDPRVPPPGAGVLHFLACSGFALRYGPFIPAYRPGGRAPRTPHGAFCAAAGVAGFSLRALRALAIVVAVRALRALPSVALVGAVV